MSKKPKPKLGWEPSGFFSFPYLSAEDFQSIVETLHIAEIPEDDRSELQKAVRDFCSDKAYRADIPRHAEVRAALLELHKNSKKLALLVQQLDTISLHKLELTGFLTEEQLQDMQNGKSDIHKIYYAALNALRVLGKDKGGRPKHKVALRGFVSELKDIFEKVTGSRATITWHEQRNEYSGLFFDFVHRCLEIADPDEIYSNSSLGQQVKQALALSRTTPG